MKNNSAYVANQPEFTQIILKELAEIKQLIGTTPKTNTPNEYLRPKEVCSLFGISRTKFDNLKRGGVFPYKKIGKDVFILRNDLEKFFYDPKTSF
jgi:hypothetical protein